MYRGRNLQKLLAKLKDYHFHPFSANKGLKCTEVNQATLSNHVNSPLIVCPRVDNLIVKHSLYNPYIVAIKLVTLRYFIKIIIHSHETSLKHQMFAPTDLKDIEIRTVEFL